MKIDTKTIVVVAITIALTIAIAPIPIVFMLPLLFTCCTRGLKMSLFMGIAFGIVSFMYALMGGSVIALAFTRAPYIPIVARILVAFFAHLAFVLAKRLIKGKSRVAYLAPYSISAVVGSLSNTLLVVGSLILFVGDTAIGDVTIKMFVPTMLVYGLFEAVTYTLITPTVAVSVESALYGKRMPKKRQKPTKNSNNQEKADLKDKQADVQADIQADINYKEKAENPNNDILKDTASE